MSLRGGVCDWILNGALFVRVVVVVVEEDVAMLLSLLRWACTGAMQQWQAHCNRALCVALSYVSRTMLRDIAPARCPII